MADFNSDQFNSFLDLDILGQDFCPQFNIHDDSNISVNQLSTDSSSNKSDALDVDFQDELEKMLNVEGSESIFSMDDHFDIDFLSSNQDDNNNNPDGEFSVKVKKDSLDHSMDNPYSSVPSNILSSQLTKNSFQIDSQSQVKEEDEEVLKVKVEGDRPTQNLLIPTKYVGHTQRKPERTIPLPKQNPKKRFLSQSNDLSPPMIPKLNLDKKVTFLGRQMVSLINKKTGQPSNNLHLQPPRYQVPGKIMLNPPGLKAHSQNPTLGSANTQLQSPATSGSLLLAQYRNPKQASSKMILVRKPGGARKSKIRRGISILKPVSPNPKQPSLHITPNKAAQKHSKDARNQMKERRATKKETKKQRLLGGLITMPRVESPGQVTSPSGWVSKEDPLKEVKNQQERDRRGQLAMYRENLRKLLPQTQEVEKVATVTVLEMAREYCGKLKHQVGQLETDQQVEEEKNCVLKRMLVMLTSGQPYLPEMEASAEEGLTIETFFERFEVEM